MIEREDEISRMKLEINNVSLRITNQLQNEYSQQIADKDGEISKFSVQIQSLKNNYSTLESEYNETQTRERKFQS